MDNVKYFEDLLESIPDYKKIVFLRFLIKNDNDLSTQCGFLKSDINRLCRDFKNISREQNEEYLIYIKSEEESLIEKVSNK